VKKRSPGFCHLRIFLNDSTLLIDSIGPRANAGTSRMEVPMLLKLYPKVHRRYTALPILGPILDGFGTWLLK
jgi:hypothetical protein